jgi:Spy/CpxP family protein refolding chaperone
MNTLTKRLLIAATAAAMLGGASIASFARAGQDGCDGPGMHGPMSEVMQKRMADHMAQRKAALKTALKLSPEQESAWTAFEAATQPPKMGEHHRPDPAEMAKLTTPQRIEKMQAMKADRDAFMSKTMEATKTFYATLTPEQQKTFDVQTLRSHGQSPRPGRSMDKAGKN